MATFAIGDLQGCFNTLQALLSNIGFRRKHDKLWFVGDLVNRGPGSLDCLRFVMQLDDRAVVVLGNHDLHLLAVAEGLAKPGKHDTLVPVLNAPDRQEILHWLRGRSLIHSENEFVMVHAGLLPQWDYRLALDLGRAVEDKLRGNDFQTLLAKMYGDEPDTWNDELKGMDRYRITINAMTRMRVVTASNRMNVKFKGELGDLPVGLAPWFARKHASFGDKTIIAGHWSALGLHHASGFIGIDTGCIWGRDLTAIRLEDRKVFQVPCAELAVPHGWE